jgi:hypothetical protein
VTCLCLCDCVAPDSFGGENIVYKGLGARASALVGCWLTQNGPFPPATRGSSRRPRRPTSCLFTCPSSEALHETRWHLAPHMRVAYAWMTPVPVPPSPSPCTGHHSEDTVHHVVHRSPGRAIKATSRILPAGLEQAGGGIRRQVRRPKEQHRWRGRTRGRNEEISTRPSQRSAPFASLSSLSYVPLSATPRSCAKMEVGGGVCSRRGWDNCAALLL